MCRKFCWSGSLEWLNMNGVDFDIAASCSQHPWKGTHYCNKGSSIYIPGVRCRFHRHMSCEGYPVVTPVLSKSSRVESNPIHSSSTFLKGYRARIFFLALNLQAQTKTQLLNSSTSTSLTPPPLIQPEAVGHCPSFVRSCLVTGPENRT
jgi:hypothetical protein